MTPAVLAALLYADIASRHLQPALLDRCPAALDSLGYRFEQRLPGKTLEYAGYVSAHLPWEGRRLLLACLRHEEPEVRRHAWARALRRADRTGDLIVS